MTSLSICWMNEWIMGPRQTSGSLLVHEQPDRHHLDAVGLDRDDPVVEHARLALGAEHQRHVGAVDVAVDDADGGAALPQRQRQVHRHRGLADPALARGHRDRVADLGDEVGRAARAAWPWGWP